MIETLKIRADEVKRGDIFEGERVLSTFQDAKDGYYDVDLGVELEISGRRWIGWKTVGTPAPMVKVERNA